MIKKEIPRVRYKSGVSVNKRDLHKRSVYISLTKRCPLKCRHCFVKRQNRELSLHKLPELMEEIAKTNAFYGVGFTGGEPFLVFETLKEGIKHAVINDLKACVLTSGYWAKNKITTEKYLNDLKGLDLVIISADKYHQQKVPLSYVENVLSVAKDLSINTVVNMFLHEKNVMGRYLSLCDKYSCNYRIGNLTLSGTKSDRLVISDMKRGNYPLEIRIPFCAYYADKNRFVPPPMYIDEVGDIYFCGSAVGLAGPKNNPFYLGNAFKDGTAWKAIFHKADKIFNFVKQNKLTFLSKIAQAGVQLRDIYYDKCDICYDTFILNSNNKYIRDNIG